MSLRILITNDDGVDAPGIAVMRDIARAISDDVWVVAPDGNQSGAGHRFTLGRELTAEEREPKVFAIIGGSPADCVVAGVTHLLGDHPPDVVLSGVNAGQNLGDVIHCSGTAAGAREGALQGAIGIAMSQGANYEQRKEVIWDNARAHAAPPSSRRSSTPTQGRDTFYNVNFPFCAPAGSDRQPGRAAPALFALALPLLPEPECRQILRRHPRNTDAARPSE